MKLFCLFFLALFIYSNSYAQVSTKTATVTDSDFKINSIGSPELNIDLKLVLPDTFQLDDEDFFDLNAGYVALLKSKKFDELIDPDVVSVEISPAAGNIIRFIVTGFSQKLSELIAKGDAGIYITVNSAIKFSAYKGDEKLSYELKVSDVEKFTSNKIILTDAMQKELIAAKGGSIFMSSNTFDFGILPKDTEENAKTEFYADFKYRSEYGFSDNVPVFFYGEGLLTTNSADTLNYLSLYPISYRFADYDKIGNRKNYDLVAQLGIEGNQKFTNYRMSGNIYWQGLIPNLINLTMGEDRLRLKPVLKAGAKFYKEYENNRLIESENEDSNQIFGELYYFVPIKKIYSLILDANAFYDFSDTLNPDDEIMYNVSITLGIDIPNTDFKTIFKYVEGENGITYQKDQQLMIGFMADLFSIK